MLCCEIQGFYHCSFRLFSFEWNLFFLKLASYLSSFHGNLLFSTRIVFSSGTIFLRIWICHDYIQTTATFHHLIVSAGAPSGFFSVTTYTYFNDISFSIWFPLKVNSFQWSVLLMDVCVCCTLCRIFVSKMWNLYSV